MDFALTISTDIRQPLLLTVKSNLMSGFECQTFLGSGRIDIPVQLHWDLDIVEFSDWEFDTFFTITEEEVDYIEV